MDARKALKVRGPSKAGKSPGPSASCDDAEVIGGRGLKQICVCLFFLAVLAAGLGSHRDYGLSWDEPQQRFTGAVNLKHVLERWAPGAETGNLARLPELSNYVDRDHGVAFELPLLAAEGVLGLRDKQAIYELRHLLTYCFCLLGVGAVYLMGASRFSDWRMGLLGAAFLVLSPRLFAESFYNSKDAVFMAAFAIGMATAIRFVTGPGGWTALVHGVATGFATDVRLMGVLLLAASTAMLAVRMLKREVPLRRTAAVWIVYFLVSMVLTVAMWPWLWADPVGNFAEAFRLMSRFRWIGDTLYMGQAVPGTALPWHYVPVWIAVTTPPLYLVLFSLGVAAIAARLARSGTGLWRSRQEMQDLFFLGLILVPLATVVALQSVLYGGWRHLYFIYPAFVLVALRGLHLLWRARPVVSFQSQGVAVVVGICLLYTAVWMAKAHPLGNVYFNAAAGGNLRDRFDLDYWGLGNRMALEYILRNDSSASIVVRADSETPLQGSIDMLVPSERNRIREAVSGEPAAYAIDNYYGPRGPIADSADFDLFHEIKVDGEVVLSIYRRKSAK